MEAASSTNVCCVDLQDIFKTIEPEADTLTNSHNRLDQYKKIKAVPSQDERRREYLQSIKDRRYDFIAQARLIAFGEDDDDEDDESEEMDTVVQRHSYRKQKRTKIKSHLKNQLMLSEWLVQLPSDFETEWLVVPCPVGKRCMVVASRGRTKAYTRKGELILSFNSVIPGGSKFSDRSTYSILDCVYHKNNKEFYILDVMCWKGHPVYDCDTTFRFYWLKTKTEETPGLDTVTNQNQYCFKRLESHTCTVSSIQQVLSSPMTYSLDGLIFYHKSCPYRQGISPLVGWLKAFMVPELLPSVAVPETLCTDKPSDYVSMQQYLVKTFKKFQTMDCDQ